MGIENFVIIKGTAEQLELVKSAIKGETIVLGDLLPEGSSALEADMECELYQSEERADGSLFLVFGTEDISPTDVYEHLEGEGLEVFAASIDDSASEDEVPTIYKDRLGPLSPVFRWEPEEGDERDIPMAEFDEDLFDNSGDDPTYDGEVGSGRWDIEVTA